MTMQLSERPITRASTREGVRRALTWFGASDLVQSAYLVTMWLVVVMSGQSDALSLSARRLELMFLLLVGACVLARGATGIPERLRSGAYRLIAVGVLLCSYLMLRDLLPAVRSGDVDSSLFAADVRLFGVAPALAVERFITPAITEYFAFFYFSYFTLCAVVTFAVIGINKNPTSTSEFAIGSALVHGLGYLGYVMVPAHGPVLYLDHAFQGPLQGGVFLRLVMETVAAGGAMKDVFPSLHTAVPVWFALYAWRRARVEGGRAWLAGAIILSFFAFNIVCSTIVLRWHYAVDVMAGLTLASFAAWCAPRLQRVEAGLRNRHGLPRAWSFKAQ